MNYLSGDEVAARSAQRFYLQRPNKGLREGQDACVGTGGVQVHKAAKGGAQLDHLQQPVQLLRGGLAPRSCHRSLPGHAATIFGAQQHMLQRTH